MMVTAVGSTKEKLKGPGLTIAEDWIAPGLGGEVGCLGNDTDYSWSWSEPHKLQLCRGRSPHAETTVCR